MSKKTGGGGGNIVFNVALGGNNPFIYASLIHLFSPIVKPNYIVIVFYDNDDIEDKNSIFLRNLRKDAHIDYFNNYKLSDKIIKTIHDFDLILTEVINKKNNANEPNFLAKIKNLLNFSYTKNTINFFLKNFFYKIPFASKLAIDTLIENCIMYNCKPIVIYIPNSNFWRPNKYSYKYEQALEFYSVKNKVNFISMRSEFANFKEKDVYAKAGPHLSPLGYKLVSNNINKFLIK